MKKFITLSVLLFILILFSFNPIQAKEISEASSSSSQATAKTNASKPLSAVEVYNEGVKLLMAAQTEQQRGETAQAAVLFQQAEQAFSLALKTTNPKLVEAQSNLGYVQLYQNAYSQAIKQFKLALKLNPNHPQTLQGLAMAYVQQQQAKKALPLFEQLTQLEPKNPSHWFNLGSTAQCLNLAQQAELAYKETLKLAPKQQAAVFNLATLKDNTLNYKEALALYVWCIKIDASSLIGLEAIKRAEKLNAGLKPTQP